MSQQPLLIYDGDCGFCEKTAYLVQGWTKGQVSVQPWQAIPGQMARLGLTAEDGLRQVWFVDAGGRLSGGAEAVNQVMRSVWWARPWTYLYRLPGIRHLEDRIYRWVADHRHQLPGGTATCRLPETERLSGR